MRFNSLDEWLVWIEASHASEIELGLERTFQVAENLQLDFSSKTVITVAGTNGKGSCVATLNTLLVKAGYTVGCYTSPHFLHYNERIMVAGMAVDDETIINSFERIDRARAQTSLTYFEFGTLAALDIFQQNDVDIVILEVGLGGRLDAVNIIDPDIAVVTSIDIDHQDWLGNDRETIGAEKAGILRPKIPVICADYGPPQSVLTRANALECELLLIGKEFDLINRRQGMADWFGVNHSLNNITLDGLKLPSLPPASVAAALQVIQRLQLTDASTIDYSVLAQLQLPGRFQQVQHEGKTLILDVAHNPAAAKHLSKQLLLTPIAGKTYGLLAVMDDKDCDQMVAALAATIDHWYVGSLLDNARAKPAAELSAVIGQYGHQANNSASVQQALQEVLSVMNNDDRLVVFGSFFTVAQVMHALTIPYEVEGK